MLKTVVSTYKIRALRLNILIAFKISNLERKKILENSFDSEMHNKNWV